MVHNLLRQEETAALAGPKQRESSERFNWDPPFKAAWLQLNEPKNVTESQAKMQLSKKFVYKIIFHYLRKQFVTHFWSVFQNITGKSVH